MTNNTDTIDLLNHIRLAWTNGVSLDYVNGLIWAGEEAASVSLAYHLRRMYLDYHPLLRMWFQVRFKDVGILDITISEMCPDFKGYNYDNVTRIDRRDLIAMEVKYASGYEGKKGVKRDIEKLENLVIKDDFSHIIPLIAYIDFSGDDENDAPTLDRILSRLNHSSVGLLYGHPFRREAWNLFNISL